MEKLGQFIEKIDKNYDLSNHHLKPLFYYLNPSQNKYKSEYLNTWAHNEKLYELARTIATKHNNVIFLKGMSLLHDIYPDLGMRFMSDIDILVHEKDMDSLALDLLREGFVENKTQKWFGDNFKREFNKVEEGREYNIELHTKLNYFNNIRISDLGIRKVDELNTLSLEDQFVYLIAHYASAHTLEKLYWLIDIYLFYCKYALSFNRSLLLEKIEKFRVKKSFYAVFFLLHDFFTISDSFYSKKPYHFMLSEVATNNFSNRMYYFLTKHLLKESILDSIQYDFLWLLNRFKSRR